MELKHGSRGMRDRQIPTIYVIKHWPNSNKNLGSKWEESNQFCLREIEGRIEEGYLNQIHCNYNYMDRTATGSLDGQQGHEMSAKNEGSL